MSASTRARLSLSARRIAARLVDGFTVFFLSFGLAVTVLFAVMAPLTDALDVGPWGRALAPALLVFVVAVTYETAFVARRGQTPGKELCNVKVIAVDAPGPRAFGRAVVAWGVLVVPDFGLALLPVAVGVVALLADPRGRSVFDRVFGTWVIDYDADIEEGPVVAAASSDEIESRYGPRLWRAVTGSLGVSKP
ncbi:MAG: RDD family protein [Acidimicrobiales bacterium]